MSGWQPIIRIAVSPAEYRGLKAAADTKHQSVAEFIRASAMHQMEYVLPKLSSLDMRIITANAKAQALYEEARAYAWPPDDRPLSVRS